MSEAPFLFEVKATPKKRVSHREEMAELKRKFGIQTHSHKAENTAARNWLALSMPMAVRLLNGYGLNQDEKTNLFDMIAGYCRLLDDGNLIADGFATEYEAVKRAAEIAIEKGDKPA